MKIAFFSLEALTDNTGSPIRMRLLIEGLADLGAHPVLISTGIPDDMCQRFDSHLFDVKADARQQLMKLLDSQDIPVIFASTESLVDVLHDVSSITKSILIVDLHGLSIIEIVERHGIKFSRTYLKSVYHALRRLRILASVDGLIVANPTLMPLARRINKRSSLVAGITDLAKFAPPSSITLHPHDKIKVYYVGNFLHWQGCDLLLDAAQLLVDRGETCFEFHFVGGDSHARSDYENRYLSLVDAEVVYFDGEIDYQFIHLTIQLADILVIPRPSIMSTYFAFPGKISDYMASGKAILATNIKPHRYIFRDGINAVLCLPSADSIASKLQTMKDSEYRQVLGTMARHDAVRLLGKDRQSKLVYDFIKKRLNDSDDDK